MSMEDELELTEEMEKELSKQINKLTLAGVNDIIIDPGFGFAKSVEQNYRSMRREYYQRKKLLIRNQRCSRKRKALL